MLPIDDAAKDGSEIYVRVRGPNPKNLWSVKWNKETCRWDDADTALGYTYREDMFSHYLPVSWVEHAGAMREALKEVNRAIYSDDYANAALLTDFNQGLVDSALAATEWPKKEG